MLVIDLGLTGLTKIIVSTTRAFIMYSTHDGANLISTLTAYFLIIALLCLLLYLF